MKNMTSLITPLSFSFTSVPLPYSFVLLYIEKIWCVYFSSCENSVEDSCEFFTWRLFQMWWNWLTVKSKTSILTIQWTRPIGDQIRDIFPWILNTVKMYFIVFLLEPKKYAVIPCFWVLDENEAIWDRFVNSGLNSSQKYLCYWASENGSERYRGAPSEYVAPNFAANRSLQFPCNEGTFLCRIVKYRSKLFYLFIFT